MGNKRQGQKKYDRIRDDAHIENMIAFKMMLALETGSHNACGI